MRKTNHFPGMILLPNQSAAKKNTAKAMGNAPPSIAAEHANVGHLQMLLCAFKRILCSGRL